MAKIGMFDSGNGGRTTLAAVRRRLPGVEIEYIADLKNAPYGTKEPGELLKVTTRVTRRLVANGAKIVVVACNTATTRCIEQLRREFLGVVFVGTEPALKRAAQRTGRGKILLLGTPNTVKSERVEQMARENRLQERLRLLPCPGLAEAVEAGIEVLEGGADWEEAGARRAGEGCWAEAEAGARLAHPEAAERRLAELLGGMTAAERDEIEVVVLGCTHYVWLRSQIQEWFPKAEVVDGNLGVAERVGEVWGRCVGVTIASGQGRGDKGR